MYTLKFPSVAKKTLSFTLGKAWHVVGGEAVGGVYWGRAGKTILKSPLGLHIHVCISSQTISGDLWWDLLQSMEAGIWTLPQGRYIGLLTCAWTGICVADNPQLMPQSLGKFSLQSNLVHLNFSWHRYVHSWCNTVYCPFISKLRNTVFKIWCSVQYMLQDKACTHCSTHWERYAILTNYAIIVNTQYVHIP